MVRDLLVRTEADNARLRSEAREHGRVVAELRGEVARLREALLQGRPAQSPGVADDADPALARAVSEAQASLSPAGPSALSPSVRRERFSVLAASKAARKRGPTRIPGVRAVGGE